MRTAMARLLVFTTAYLVFHTWWTGAMIAETYNEPDRPQFHFTPPKNWMNDPNGLVYYRGEYHLFYQYNPFGNDWGHMSWGHAVSRDLVRWKNLPVAISEESGVMIFSGSVVVDEHNSSGFCRASRAEDSSCLVAIYTGYNGKFQNQNVAYSNDDGRSWTKYSDNPVIDLHLQDFRDPKVFWHEATHRWLMVTALSSEHKVRLFSSTDLKHWILLSDFGPAGATEGVWECPDLFQLPVDGAEGQTRWVLSININPGSVAGGSGNQYFIGQFDGSTFTNEKSQEQVMWADYGKDFYASTSFSDIPTSDGRRIWIGWLDNWDYAAKVPTSPWRGEQSIPRELKLKRFADGIRLTQQPVSEVLGLRKQHESLEGQNVRTVNRWLNSKGVRGESFEIVAEIDPGHAAEVGFYVRKGAGEKTIIAVDTKRSKLFVDRTHSGRVNIDPKFPGRQEGPVPPGTLELHIYVDRSSVEVFGNEGETVISDRIFPARSSRGIELYSHGGEARVLKIDVWNLNSAWQ